jgi:L-seryl-tRNA(Ser) seleniumtransferase
MDSVDGNTAAIGYVISRWLPPDPPGFLPALCAAAHQKGVPVIVDAAAMLPPLENLTRYIAEGVDLVAYSGGKAIRGPQSTGILAVKKVLIEAAAMNNSPNSAIGRVAKVCKEEIVGLVTALEMYVNRDHEADQQRWRQQAQVVADALEGIPGVTAHVLQDDFSRPVPEAAIVLGPDYTGPPPEKIAGLMREGDPPIVTGQRTMLRSHWDDTDARNDDLFVNPHNIFEGDERIVAERLKTVLEIQSA